MDPATTTAPSPAPTAPPGGGTRAHRRLRNMLVNTSLQLRLASYLIAVSVALSAGLGWLLWQAYRETSRVIALGDPESGDPLALALASEDRVRIVLVSAALVGVLLCLLGASVVITHRIAGPAFAITRTCRLVGEGHLTRPRPLRARDLLVELAGAVAGMVDALRAREARDLEVALAAAAALRDPAASPVVRGAAAEALEQLAREKEQRLQS
jgi:hypothetical protein